MVISDLLLADFGKYCAIGYRDSTPIILLPLQDDAQIGNSVGDKQMSFWNTQSIRSVSDGSDDPFETVENRDKFFKWFGENINELV